MRRTSPPHQLLLDAARCDGHGICALRCPERISLDEWGFAAVDPTAITDAAMLARARRAAAACPEGVLAVAPLGAALAPVPRPSQRLGGPPDATALRRRAAVADHREQDAPTGTADWQN